jgi:regulator of cell morphogenesis and NO signaling
MGFTGESKLRDIALSNSAARHVLEDAHLDYCCGGSKSLRDACSGVEVSVEEILERVQENSRDIHPDATTWAYAPLSDLTEYIREKHHQYVRGAIPRIRDLAAKVKARHGSNHAEIAVLEGLFARVGQEMIMHMQKEEQILFPYIEAMERAVNGSGTLEPPFFQTVRNPIQVMMKEHDSAGDLVKQIRNVSLDYAAPADACASYRALYQHLHEFESDLHLHVHLENNILFPRAMEMEATAK